MTPFQSFIRYIAIKNHFTKDSYDAIKYNFKINIKKETFDKRKDKHFFEKLSKHKDINGLLISLFIRNPELWIGDIMMGYSRAEEIYIDWLKRKQSILYIFKNDCSKLNLHTCFKTTKNQHPPALLSVLQGDISIETLVILDDLIGCVAAWNKKLKGDIIYDQYALVIKKYKSFLTYDRTQSKIILNEQLKGKGI